MIERSELSVVFMGTPDFAVPTLDAVLEAGFPVRAVVSQPARPAGRGRKVKQTPVGARAEAEGIPLFQWPRLNNHSYATLSEFAPDVCVVVAYGKILPRRYLELPRFGCLNVHASVLPKYRGAAPIQWAVIRGEATSGVSIMRLDEGMDTGDVARVVQTPIGPDETAGELHDRLAPMGAQALVEVLSGLCDGTTVFTPQDHTRATEAPRLSKDDGRIDWSRPAAELHDRVRGTHPWPGAWFEWAGEPFKVHRTRRADGGGSPGEVLGHEPDGPRIACGDGALVLTRVQRPGRGPVAGADFLRGGDPMPVGTCL
jgi:methionyl-tRNA formyltransferase